MVYGWTEWLIQQLFPATCCSCADPGLGRYDICGGCYRELPRLANSCRLCAEPLPSTGLVCGRCQSRPPAFDRVIAPYLYTTPMDSLIQELKFSGRLSTGRLLGELLARHLQRCRASADLLLPVPLHQSRLRQRGFNQSVELARPLKRALGIAVDTHRLRRIRRTEIQSELPRDERRRNVRNAFAFRGRLDGQTVAVIDDVVTTGSTADVIARSLKRAGAARVEIWTVARAGRRLL